MFVKEMVRKNKITGQDGPSTFMFSKLKVAKLNSSSVAYLVLDLLYQPPRPILYAPIYQLDFVRTPRFQFSWLGCESGFYNVKSQKAYQ